MPEGVALATTRRKLFKTLDEITTSSQVSLAPSTSATTTTAKRPATAAAAFDEARERAAKRLRHSTSSSSLPYQITPPTTTLKKSEVKPRDLPNYSPWSHEAFLARMKTFSKVSYWHPKPEAISEVEWAKRGWFCVDVNTVGCKGGCERRLVVSLERLKNAATAGEGRSDSDDGADDDDEDAFEQMLAERYKDEIIDGHGQNCLWRKAGCKDDIYRLQVVRPAVWQPELRKRYQSALEISGAIRNVKTKAIERNDPKPSTPEKLLKELPSDVLSTPDSAADSEAPTNALEVALHGWRGSTESGSELLHCDACFQRIGLWMYQPGYRPAHPDSDDEESHDAAIIDLVEIHRDHCPWRNPATQQASGSLKGFNACEILQRVVATYSRDQRRRSNEQTAVENGHLDQPSGEDTESADAAPPELSREEITRQDKERESKLRRLKSLFTIKRRSKVASK